MRLPPALILHHKWRLCIAISLCALALACWPHALSALRYDRTALLSGQAWRIVSAHLVHLNTFHLLLNLLGLFLVCELWWQELPLLHGVGLLSTAGLGVSALLWWLHPELAWYVGLSGAVHGLWAGCALAGCRPLLPGSQVMPALSASSNEAGWQARRAWSDWIYPAGLLLLAIKLVVEAQYGSAHHTAQAIGGQVVSVAHFYGALTGFCYILIGGGLQRMRRKNAMAADFGLK